MLEYIEVSDLEMNLNTVGEGVRVVLHPPNVVPYTELEGYDVPPGRSAGFFLSKIYHCTNPGQCSGSKRPGWCRGGRPSFTIQSGGENPHQPC